MLVSIRARVVSAFVVSLGALAAAPVAQAAIFTQEAGSPYAQSAGTDTYGLATGDFNGDTRPDIVAVNGTTSTITVHLRTAANGFTQEGVPISVPGGAGYAKTADFNGDGKTDIVVTTNSGTVNTFIRNVANNGFTAEGAKPTFDAIADLTIGNFNNDGRPDLAVSHYATGKVMTLMRLAPSGPNPTGSWDIEADYPTGSTDPRGLAVFDFNNDGGTDDIAVANRATPGTTVVTVLKRNGNPGTGFTQTAGEGFATHVQPTSVVARDFNGDGRIDLAVDNYGNDNVDFAYRRASGATWDLVEAGGGGSNFFIGDAPIGLVAGDFNLDGRPDVAASASGEDKVGVLLRRANNTTWDFESPTPVTPGDTPNAIVAADFNGDGRLDVATANQATNNFSVLRNNFGQAPVANTRPTLAGTPRVGDQLQCNNGSWAAAPNPTFQILWDRALRATTADNDPSWAPINGAAGEFYTVRAEDAGSRVRCRVVATNVAGSAESVSVSKRTDNGVPLVQVRPRILGTPIVGQVLTCDAGVWTEGPDFTYEWFRNLAPIAGQTQSTYQTSGADDDAQLACSVTARNDVGGVAADAPRVHVVGGPPVLQSPPLALLEDTVGRYVGRKVTCDPGKWSRDDGNYSFRWYRNDAEIPGAIGSTYVVTAEDLGTNIGCSVVNTNLAGASGLVRSNEDFISLPPGTGGGQMVRTGGTTELDPVNFMAISSDYLAVIRAEMRERLQKLVDATAASCKRDKSIPTADFNPDILRAPLTDVERCRLLVKHPERVVITDYGARMKQSNCQDTGCPNIGLSLPAVDPARPPAEDAALLARLKPVTPERVLWDIDNNGSTDVSCPGTAPVLRTLLDPGRWQPRAVIVTDTSDETGIYGQARDSFAHPDSSQSSKRPLLRKAQPFVCRTSVDPPPEPEQGPCMTEGTIGRIKFTEANLCPISVRSIPLEELRKNFPIGSEDYKTLSEITHNLPLHRFTRRVAPDPPALGQAFAATASDRFAVSAYRNASAGLTSQTTPKAYVDASSAVGAGADYIRRLAKAPGFNQTKGPLALDQIYIARGPFKLNGVDFDPNDVLPMIVPSDVQDAIPHIKEMRLVATDVANSLGGLPLATGGEVRATLNDAANAGASVLRDALYLDKFKEKLDKYPPFKVRGADAKIELGKDGTATLKAKAEIPFLTTTNGPLRVDLTLNGDQSGNLKLQGIKLGPVGAKLGGVNLNDLRFEYDGGFSVSGQFLFPPNGEGININRFAIKKNGDFDALSLDYVAGAGSGIPVGPGVYLTTVGGGIETIGPPSTILNAHVVVAAGPSVGGGCPAAGVDSQLLLKFGGQYAISADVTAKVILVCLPLGELKFHADSSPYVSIEGTAAVKEAGFEISGFMKGQIKGDQAWQITGGATVGAKIPIVGFKRVKGNFAISNLGVAVCVDLDIVSGGAGVKFTNGRPPLTTLELLSNLVTFYGCGMKEFKPLGRRVVANTAGAGPPASTFTLPSVKGAVLSIEGAGAAPRVKLRSPTGKEYDFTNAVEPVKLPDAQAQIVEEEDRTVVILKGPKAGRWTAEPAEGSPAIARVRLSTPLPEPKITGKVVGAGSSRALTYSVTPIAGQVVTFVEDANGSGKILKTVKNGGRGTVRYVTGEARSTSRTIVAQVSQDGLPRKNITIARYSAPNPTVGRPSKIKITRKGGKATITWKGAPLAKSYEVSVTTGDGGRGLYFPKGKRLQVVVPGVAADERVAVVITAASASGRKGPAGRATLAPPKAKKPPKKKK